MRVSGGSMLCAFDAVTQLDLQQTWNLACDTSIISLIVCFHAGARSHCWTHPAWIRLAGSIPG